MKSTNLRVVEKIATAQDFALVEERIRRRALSGEDRSMSFSKYVCDQVFCIAPDALDEHITDGPEDRGIDIIFIDAENLTINFGSCKCVAGYKKSKKNFPGKEIDKIITFLDDLLLRNEEIFRGCNGKIAAKVREIWELFDQGELFKLNVHLFSNQLPLAEIERTRLNDYLTIRKAFFTEHSLYELAHGVIRSKKATFSKLLRPNKSGAYDEIGKSFRGKQFSVPIKEIVKFVTSKDNDAFDDRIIDQNVRYFLGLNNIVNMKIRETLISGSGDKFWALNNGITIACEQYAEMPGAGNPITLKNPYIVNGGQTVRVIHDVATNTLAELPSGSINVKIVESTDFNFIEEIALASNTQSRIYGRDLRAFDPLQEKLAVLGRVVI